MNCYKYILTNTGTTISTFTYRRCDDTVWQYQVELDSNQIKTIWAIENTYSTGSYDILTISVEPFNPVVPTPSVTPTNTPTPSVTPTNTPTPSVTPSVTPTNTPTPSVTKTGTPTPTPTETQLTPPTPSVTETKTPTPTPTLTETPTPTPTLTPGFVGTFRILTQSSDSIQTENNDYIAYQN
jgi:hypothetical protein